MPIQLGKFIPRITELSSPLHELLGTKNTWVWGESQNQSFEAIKHELAKPTVLALYNLKAKIKHKCVPMFQLLGWEQCFSSNNSPSGSLLPMLHTP